MFRCPKCDKEFSSRARLGIHTNQEHGFLIRKPTPMAKKRIEEYRKNFLRM